MKHRTEGEFINRTFRISAEADKTLTLLSHALDISKSELVEEAIELMIKKRVKEIRAGNRRIQKDLRALIEKY